MDAFRHPHSQSSSNTAVEILPGAGDRLARACERCWKRKQKCDRKAPVCSTCKESHAVCQPRIVTVDVETLPNDPSKSVTHVAGYVASLKRKSEGLRSELQTKRVKIGAVTTPNSASSAPGYGVSISSASPSVPSSLNNRRTGSINNQQDAEDDVHAAMGEIEYLSLSAMAEPRDSSTSHAQPLSLRTILRAAANLRGSEPYTGSLSAEPSFQVKTSTMLTDFTTISRTMTIHFVQHFLDEFSVKTPALSERYVMPIYESLFSGQTNEHVIGSSTALPDLFSYNIIAIGILHSPESTSLKHLASKLHNTAIDQMPMSLEKEDPVLALQFQISLVIYSLYSSSGGSAWHFLGMAMRRLIALGFHREPEVHDSMNDEEIDLRRWLFWSAYILDRQISSAMDRPCAIQDEEITLKEPSIGQSFTSPIHHHILAHARLISRMRGPGEEDSLFHWYNLTSWQSNTPVPRTIHDRLNYHSKYLQQLACCGFAQIVDTKWLCNIPIRGINGSSLQEAVRQSLGEFVQNFHDRIEEEHFACSFVDAYDIFSMGVIYLLLSNNSRNIEQDLSDFTSRCSTILTIIAQDFRPLRILKKALWALNGVITRRNTFIAKESLQISPNQNYDEQQNSPALPGSDLPVILERPPLAIPYRIGQLIRSVLSSESAAAAETRRR